MRKIYLIFLDTRPEVLGQFAVLAQKIDALHQDLDPMLAHFAVHPKNLTEETNRGLFL